MKTIDVKSYKRSPRDVEQDAIALLLNPSLPTWAAMHRAARDVLIARNTPEQIARARREYRKAKAQEAVQ